MDSPEQHPTSAALADVRRWQPPLFLQQVWFIRLRWVAGLAVLAGGLIDWQWLGWYRQNGAIATAGVVILTYNAVLWALTRRGQHGPWARWRLFALAWAQILLDLACLTALTAWTGGYQSPLLGFYVFHMVFASLLLPRLVAFGVAAVAIAMVEIAMGLAGAWPRDRVSLVAAVAWGLTLVATVYLAGHITESLRNQRRRLVRQNRRIRAMTKRLRRQQLAMARQEKMAAMGQMAAGVAHEVANPLASMDGLLQLMERKPDRIGPEALVRLREQVARINAIVRQMTTFAHPGEGHWALGNVNDVVTRALEVIRFDQRLKRVEVECDLAAGMPEMNMLAAALEQVVVNLAINALDAMEHAKVAKLMVRTALMNGTCVVEIGDTGMGIAEENKGKLFEPFFTTKPVGKGTGLGLSISYSLVRKHGGNISVESELGKGTVFAIRLPVGAVEGVGAERAESSRGR